MAQNTDDKQLLKDIAAWFDRRQIPYGSEADLLRERIRRSVGTDKENQRFIPFPTP